VIFFLMFAVAYNKFFNYTFSFVFWHICIAKDRGLGHLQKPVFSEFNCLKKG
jgi:hypothetical protein